ncbi:MAG: DUF3363 domain-containing protein, partial [Acidobacteriaceae bacterium]|nr:DUF3363 domain-containing protein [Acidobacteriaceae bacterium]
LAARQDFLIESGFAERRGPNVIYKKALLATLRDRELEVLAARIHAETGLIPRPVEEGQPFSGVYRASTQLISGRFAMLDDGIGFTLVPWLPAIEKQLGRELTITVRGDLASWEISRKRDVSR